MKSYLTALDDGSFMRVQYGSKINGLLVEYYDKDFNLTGTKIIGKELPVFGGFYATKDNYYVVTGENNTDEDNTKEVYRITKYDKHWNKITSTVTVRPKYNPESAKTYKITVYDPLQINKFEADTNDPKIGEKVNLSVEAQNGSGDLQYKFYEENEDGDQTKTLKKHTVI